MPLLLEPQIHGIEEMLDRVTDFNCSHIPIEMNIFRDKELKELVYALPCLLGSAAIRNSGYLDLSKPIFSLLQMQQLTHLSLESCLSSYQWSTKIQQHLIPKDNTSAAC